MNREAPSRRPAPRRKAPGILPALALLVLLGGAAYVAILADRAQRAAKAAPPEEDAGGYKPFANVPPETIPERPGRPAAADDGKPDAPDDLQTDANWRRALEIADRGWKLSDEAAAARMADDQTLFRQKAQAAREAFDEAFTMTAAWEEELLDKYGERDPQVREILRTRNKWIEKVRLFHKTAPLGG